MDFRFIHAADIHLDSPLRGLAGQEGRIAERIRNAPRRAFENLVARAIDERVDFVLIAGDLYDGAWRDYNTGLFFAAEMGRLNAANVPVFIIHGNHDAESRITTRLPLPGNVHLLPSAAPATCQIAHLAVAIHGQSFKNAAVTANIAAAYPEPWPGFFNIGLLHTGLGGMGGHANYAPCSLEDLIGRGYDYWALGHVHQRTVLNHHPHVVFAGNLQGRHVRETGRKGATLVEVREQLVTGLEELVLDEVRWAVLSVDIGEALSAGDVIERVRGALDEALPSADGRLLVCRIVLEGASALHGRLVGDIERIRAELRSLGLGMGDDAAWIEKIVVATQPLRSPSGGASEGPPSDLLDMLDRLADDPRLQATLKDDLDDFRARLPVEVRDLAGDEGMLPLLLEGDHAALVKKARDQLIARLLGSSEA